MWNGDLMTTLVASSWQQNVPYGESPWIMSRKPEALSDTALFVADIWAFTDGTPHAWSSESIKAVTDWRTPFGDDGTALMTEQCDLVIVPSLDVSYHDLQTRDFFEAWARFANDNDLQIRLQFEA